MKKKNIDIEYEILSLVKFYEGGVTYDSLLEKGYAEIFNLMQKSDKLAKEIKRNINKK